MRVRRFTPPLVAAVCAALLAGCAAHPPLATAPRVDLTRYAGTWYEIARLPNSFQDGCADVTATYTPRSDGQLDVLNQCLRDGEMVQARAVAWSTDPPANAKLLVQFFWPFRGDYWILAVDPDYRWALVGDPSREYLWILSRTATMPPDAYAAVVERARALGFDTARLARTPQR